MIFDFISQYEGFLVKHILRSLSAYKIRSSSLHEKMIIPHFREVVMRDELPKGINPVECKTRWMCFARNHDVRTYFDSYGRFRPKEWQKYLKTQK